MDSDCSITTTTMPITTLVQRTGLAWCTSRAEKEEAQYWSQTQIYLENATFSRIKASFSFYSVNLQHSDNVCLEYELDNGAVTGHKCWSTLHAFENSRWYDNMSFEFDASDANSLVIGLKVEGDLGDHVLIDSVSVQGQI